MMMNQKGKFGVSIVACCLLVGCMTTGGPKETGGTLLGAGAGALIGSQIGKGDGRLVGVALGTLIGAGLGNHIGKTMDARDRQLAASTARYALENQPDHRVSAWRNPNNNHSGQFVVTRTEERPGGTLVCRDYVQTVMIDGRQEKVHGRACRDVRDPRAHWSIQQ